MTPSFENGKSGGLAEILAEFGADPDALRLFAHDGPELLNYATILSARSRGDDDLSSLLAVYEWQGAPLVYLVDASGIKDDTQVRRLRRILAMRGDAPYLGIVQPGQLRVYRLALDDKAPAAALVSLEDLSVPRATVFARLSNSRPGATQGTRNWISSVILNLLTGAIDGLIRKCGVRDEDAISLVGRALFTRFLADRELLPTHLARDAATLFDTAAGAAATSAWLDSTFNGDLLPLHSEVFNDLPNDAFRILGNVMRRAHGDQLLLGWEESWDHLDFAHIPVGILSQAYELYMRNHARGRQRRQGGYYTPPPIADLMVRAAFLALQRQGVANAARILDPAAGAGVFLLIAFRELVAASWRAAGERPDTAKLRALLYGQIRGFDVDEAALRFAALGLYLMTIELDPAPKPASKLRFDAMRGTVLRLLRDTGAPGEALGSLGPLVGSEENGRYDLVIGNPPWSSATGLRHWKIVAKTVSRIAAERSVKRQVPIPNEVLDLPFVWRAMEWAKPGGQIAFALHARILFQQGEGMADARQALFEALDVASIINGADLRHSKVWPEISAPFCLLMATNINPGSTAGFRLISPRAERALNEHGVMRIDAMNAEIVAPSQLREMPDMLKILFRGSEADLGIVRRIRDQGYSTLGAYWRATFGSHGHNLKGSGSGYQRLRSTSKPTKSGDGLPGYRTDELAGLKEVSSNSFTPVQIDHDKLTWFAQERVHRLRTRALFNGPVVVVHKSPSASSGRIGVAVSETDIVFSETFYGYSTATHSDALSLAHYLTLVLGSKLAIWFALMTSGEFGFEREVIEKLTIDRLPFPDFSMLDERQRHSVDQLFESLRHGEADWEDVDCWVASLYGLGARDLQVISDTLEFNLPYAQNRRQAEAPPTPLTQAVFCQALEEELRPWAQRFGSDVSVRLAGQMQQFPWHAVQIFGEGQELPTKDDWQGLLLLADHTAATEVLFRQNSSLLVGRLAQQRYWSISQARSLAQRIVWSHLDVIRGKAA